MRRIVKITIGGAVRVVDLLRATHPPATSDGGFGQAPFGVSPFGTHPPATSDGGFGQAPFGVSPFGN